MRWLKAVGGLLLIMILAVSCIKVEGDIKIADDGSGNVDFLSALNTEAFGAIFEEMGMSEDDFGSSAELCEEFEDDTMTDVPADATVTPYNEDGFCGARVSYELQSSTDHSSQISAIFEDGARLYKEGDNWFFDVPFNTDDITADSEELGAGMAESFFGDASFVINLDLPGKAIQGESNADEIGNNGTFRWDIDILNPPTRLFAQTEPGSDGSGGLSGGGSDGDGGGLLKILLPILAIALLGLGAWWFLKNRGGGTDIADPAVGGLDGVSPVGNLDASTMPGQQFGMPVSGGPAVSVQDAGSGLAGGITNVAAPIAGAAGAAGAAASGALSGAGDAASGALSGAGDAASGALSGAGDAVSGALPNAGAAVGGVLPNAGDAAEAAKETIMMNQDQVQQAVAEATADTASTAAAATPAAPQPVYDEALGAWTVNDPARGRLRHDPATDTWNPI